MFNRSNTFTSKLEILAGLDCYDEIKAVLKKHLSEKILNNPEKMQEIVAAALAMIDAEVFLEPDGRYRIVFGVNIKKKDKNF